MRCQKSAAECSFKPEEKEQLVEKLLVVTLITDFKKQLLGQNADELSIEFLYVQTF